MDQGYIEDFKSLDSMDSSMSETTLRSGSNRINPNGQFNPAFGDEDEIIEMTTVNGQPSGSDHEDDIMMTDMLYTNVNECQQLRGADGSLSSRDGDKASIASTDTYQSEASASSKLQQSLKENLPSHLFREIRALPRGKSRRQALRGAATPEGSVSSRAQSSIRRGLDETNFVLMGNEDEPRRQQEEIRHMATSLKRKKTMLNQVQDNKKKEEEKYIGSFKYFKLRLAASWQHFKKKVVQMIKDNELWSGPLKRIQGKFGTGVHSYFIFLRWLFLLNVLIFLMVFLFIFIPQIIYQPSVKESNPKSFDGTELIDGRGWFNATELYYGHYTSDTIPISEGYGYNMPLAYFLTCASYLLICLVIMVTSMTTLYEKTYLEGGTRVNVITTKIFTAWDYSVTDREACLIKQQSIATDLEEFLAETKVKRVLSRREWFSLISFRMLTNFVSLALIACATYLIVEVVAGYPVEDDTTIFQELLLPLLVSFLNLLLPGMFRLIASFENYDHGATAVKVSLARTVLLKLCTLAGIFVSLYRDIDCVSDDDTEDCRIYGCWENYVGQTFYRLVWVDFAFILLATFFGEFIRRVLSSRFAWWESNIGNPGFDISRNVLDLIYAQSLCWFGTFFSPLLSFICLFKLWVLFYVKKTSVLKNCRPSARPFLASKMNLLFLLLLGIAYALILIAFGYTVTSGNRLSPSECGPFIGKDSIYQVVLDSVNSSPTVLKEIVHNISSPNIIALVFVVIGVFIYYYKLLKSSNEKKMKLLRQQIVLTGKDKLYLMKKINENEKNKRIMEVEQ